MVNQTENMGQKRGMGGNGRGGSGPGGYCICPNCGKKVPHKRGVPCITVKCPECNIAMIRE